MLLIGGEPGVGKTRLVEQALSRAQARRCLSLTGRCYEMEGTPPFIPFVELLEQADRTLPEASFRETLGEVAAEVARLMPELRRRFPDLPPALELPPEQQRRYLFKSVCEWLDRLSRHKAVVVLLDDLQWADDSTLLLLQHLVPQLSHMPLLVLGTFRDVELTADRPFLATLETLTRQRLARRLKLERLPEQGVAAMLTALGGPEPPTELVRTVFRETQATPSSSKRSFSI